MKRKALSVVAVVVAGALGVAAALLRPGAEPRTAPRAAGPAAGAVAKEEPTSPERRLAEDPALSRAMKCWRVHEDLKDGVFRARSWNYESEAGRDGLKFLAAGRRLSLGAPTLVQGGRTISCAAGAASRVAFAHAAIDRQILVEEYLFENGRVEQLFRFEHPVGQGDLTLRIPVETDLGGGVIPIPARSEGRLQSAGLRFTDAGGKTSFTYHSAVVIDAHGERLALAPRYESGEIALAVPGEFLARAAYPVVVDPYLELDASATGPGFSITSGFSDQPAIAIEGGGNPYVVWSERVSAAPANFEIFLRYWNGLAWTNLGGSDQGGGISSNSGDSTHPSVALERDGLGVPAVAWQDDTSGNFEIYCRRWDGTAWAALPTATGGSGDGGGISGTSGESRNPAIAFVQAISPYEDPPKTQEVPVVVWEDTSFGLPEIFARVWYPGDPGDPGDSILGFPAVPALKAEWYEIQDSAGNNFQSVSANPAGTAERPKVARDPQNRVLVTWQGTADVSVATSTYEIMFVRFTIFPVPHNSFFGDVNPNGEFYPDPGATTGNFGLTQMKGTWDGTTASSGRQNVSGTAGPSPAGRSTNPSLAINRANGTLYIAWEESLTTTNSEIYVAESTLGTSAWGGAGTGPSGGASNAGTGVSATLTPSRTPSISVDGTNQPVVVWVDDEPGNFEIYLRQLQAGTWTQLGFGVNSAGLDAGNPLLGGISKTFTASLFPVVRVGNGGLPTVAWADWTGGTGPGGTANFDIYARRFYSNEPRNMRILTTDPVPVPIPAGGFTTLLSVDLRCTVFSEPTNVQCFMEVEVKPTTALFVGTVTASSLLVPIDPTSHLSTVEASVIFSGLSNTAYHVRFRTVDQVGRRSPWLSYGGNADGVADFTVGAPPPGVPGAPTNLTAVSIVGGVQLDWSAAPGAVTYNIYRDIAAGFIPALANRIASGQSGLTFVDATVAASTTYFYQVRGENSVGEGPSSNEATVTTPGAGGGGGGGGPPPGSTANLDDEEACGLMGAEALLLAMAALAFVRGRRRG